MLGYMTLVSGLHKKTQFSYPDLVWKSGKIAYSKIKLNNYEIATLFVNLIQV